MPALFVAGSGAAVDGMKHASERRAATGSPQSWGVE